MGGPWHALQHPLKKVGHVWGGFLGVGGSRRPQSYDDLLEGSGLQLLLGFVDVPQVNPLGNMQWQVTDRGCAVCLEVWCPDRHRR